MSSKNNIDCGTINMFSAFGTKLIKSNHCVMTQYVTTSALFCDKLCRKTSVFYVFSAKFSSNVLYICNLGVCSLYGLIASIGKGKRNLSESRLAWYSSMFGST